MALAQYNGLRDGYFNHKEFNMAFGESDTLGLIDVPKSCDMLASRLRNQILSGVYPAGTQLPAERDLVSQTGLSRNAIREGLRILEAEGLVQTRLGRYGGSFVCQPSDEMFARHFRVYARGRKLPLEALLEARESLEPRIAMLAAANRNSDDLAELQGVLDRLAAPPAQDPATFLAETRHWIYGVATASHNELLRVFMTSLAELIHDLSGLEDFTSEASRKEIIHIYQRIFQAIADGDVAAAGRRAERHVKAYSERARKAGMTL
ncbi:hypothetical protein CAL22_04020 [Bordetella genomosp. 12]|uniref:HTH gntR-type domain-containing protein n=2 Tax=Bordetella genomosp. 12 TaxID=463035 RepID=A0A261VV62_9BORD|nr:hypothetical protein CAL22_04020 [Bordetella genomosp. 12]